MNARKTIIATLFAAAFVAPLAVAPVQAQIQAQATRSYTQAELDQMLAPIALYPDALLSQVLMAATYPIEVVEAARWTRANPNLQGDDAVRAVENQDWDPSVKSLVAFPQILQRMDEQLSWTESLGDAFLAQEPQVMDSVQHLRRRAQAAGNLQSSEQIYVQQQGPTILIQPASPQYVYVPYYDPLVVYGTWWWPAYRPVHWAPWPGYARPYRAGFWWGAPVGLSVNFFFGNVDWHRRHVHVSHPRAYYYRPPVFVNRTVVVDRGRWQHDPHHRRGVDYRAAEVRQRFAAAQGERREEQRQDRRQDQREVRSPWQRQDAQTQMRPEQTRQDRQERQERREVREEQQRPRSDAGSVERAQQRQQREQAQATQAAERAQRQQQQQREQSQAAERVQRDQQRQQQQQQQQRERAQNVERTQRDQLRQQVEAARGQQQRQQAEAARAQQRQQSEAARAQQQQQRQEQRAAMPAAKALQTPRAERQEQREERREGRHEQRQDRGQKG